GTRQKRTHADDRSHGPRAGRLATAAPPYRNRRASRLQWCCTRDCQRTGGRPINSLLKGDFEPRGRRTRAVGGDTRWRRLLPAKTLPESPSGCKPKLMVFGREL